MADKEPYQRKKPISARVGGYTWKYARILRQQSEILHPRNMKSKIRRN